MKATSASTATKPFDIMDLVNKVYPPQSDTYSSAANIAAGKSTVANTGTLNDGNPANLAQSTNRAREAAQNDEVKASANDTKNTVLPADGANRMASMYPQFTVGSVLSGNDGVHTTSAKGLQGQSNPSQQGAQAYQLPTHQLCGPPHPHIHDSNKTPVPGPYQPVGNNGFDPGFNPGLGPIALPHNFGPIAPPPGVGVGPIAPPLDTGIVTPPFGFVPIACPRGFGAADANNRSRQNTQQQPTQPVQVAGSQTGIPQTTGAGQNKPGQAVIPYSPEGNSTNTITQRALEPVSENGSLRQLSVFDAPTSELRATRSHMLNTLAGHGLPDKNRLLSPVFFPFVENATVLPRPPQYGVLQIKNVSRLFTLIVKQSPFFSPPQFLTRRNRCAFLAPYSLF